MTTWTANAILSARKRRIKAYNNVRFHKDGYEYRLTYEGGFFGFLKVDRRSDYKPNGRFSYVTTIIEDDLYMDDVIGYIKSKV